MDFTSARIGQQRCGARAAALDPEVERSFEYGLLRHGRILASGTITAQGKALILSIEIFLPNQLGLFLHGLAGVPFTPIIESMQDKQNGRAKNVF